jgi:hypothetical protein
VRQACRNSAHLEMKITRIVLSLFLINVFEVLLMDYSDFPRAYIKADFWVTRRILYFDQVG